MQLCTWIAISAMPFTGISYCVILCLSHVDSGCGQGQQRARCCLFHCTMKLDWHLANLAGKNKQTTTWKHEPACNSPVADMHVGWIALCVTWFTLVLIQRYFKEDVVIKYSIGCSNITDASHFQSESSLCTRQIYNALSSSSDQHASIMAEWGLAGD